MHSPTLLVKALYDFDSNETNLSFKRNDIIQVFTQLESGWWDGVCNGERGWFPSNYVTTYEEDDLFDDEDKLGDWIPQQTPDGDIFYYNTRTGESSWELPADDSESITTINRDTIISSNDSLRQLPENWTRKPTENGKTYYYLNIITKEVRWTYPENGTTTVASSNSDIDETDDKASIASSHDSQISSTTDGTIQQRSLQGSRQGKPFENESLSNGSEIEKKLSHEQLPPIPTETIPHQLKNISESSILMLQNANEQLTWDSLLRNIILAIDHLNLATKENMKKNYPDCTNVIVESIRIMLYASGAIEKDSPAIRQNMNLKVYHRHIMASLSKLVLSTRVASSVWPPSDAAQKMKNDVHEVLIAVQKFVETAKPLVVIKRVDPKILENVTGGSWRGNNLLKVITNGINGTNGRFPKPPSISSSVNSQENNSPLNSPTTSSPSHSLSSELNVLLEQSFRTVNQAIILLVNHIKKVIDAPQSLISNTSVPFASQLVSQTRQVATQVGQFLSLIENINLEDFSESSSDTINEFKISKQALYNNIAALVICTQSVADPLASLNALDKVLTTTNIVDKVAKDVIIAIKFLVEENETREQMKSRPRRPTITSNSLDQIVEGNSNDLTEDDQSTTPSTSPPISSSMTGLETVPEDDVMTTDGDSTVVVDAVSYDNVIPMSPISAGGESISSNNRHLSNSVVSSVTWNDAASSQSSPPLPSQQSPVQLVAATSSNADYPNSSSSTLDDGTRSPRKEHKVSRFFGEVVPKQKEKDDKPWYLSYDYDPSEMLFNMESYVKGGTLDALAERLTLHDSLDSNFIATFLLTYRSFCTTDELFDRLFKRFMIQPPDGLTREELEVWQEKKQTPIRLRVFNIMKTWLEYYYMDDEDAPCLERLREFASTTMNDHMSFASINLMKLADKRAKMIITNSDRPPAPILPKNIKKLKFLDLDPLEIARQLTLIESKLYNKIKPVECLDKAWSKEEGDNIAVNIKAMIVNSNQITGWVAESVLNQSEVKRRCLYIKHFVAVADKCKFLNNFNSLTAIISGLNSAPIHRLKRTWELVNAKTIQTLEVLNKTMNSTKNFAEYRETLHSVNPPCVPFLGVYLTDLTFIEDGNPNTLKKSRPLINFSKRMKTAEVIREIKQYQSVPYNLAAVQEIQMFIKCHLQDSRDVGDLYDQSLSMEPREREDEKIARLLQESGFL
ncbi:5238_t:CDS:2 [Funneliformis caledonium]|uniref:5238_t:CDS:1 n=1 Tax=Funneliformis caledonium TaxID=1117310 RepID=A0A9N8WEJ7_9GLOM|nr:5238_t:CDS:2 [Funneliformis caledonium]